MSSRSTKFEIKKFLFGKLKGTIKILSAHYFFCPKFAAVWQKIANFCPLLLF